MITTNFKDANEASISLEAISEMAETMNEIYEQMKRIPKHLYGQYYLREKAKYDASRVMRKYNGWKTQEWDETFESLKDLQTLVVAEFLTKRPLRFSRRPTLREIAEVQLDLVQNRLSNVFAYCEDFKEMCARFRRFNWWEGDILKLDYNRYGKYLLFNYHKMTEEERRAFFELDIMLEQKKPECWNLSLPMNKITKYFPESYTPQKMEETIIKLLEAWMRHRVNQKGR